MPRIVLAAVCIASLGCVLFYRLADRDLWSSHEARAAQNAQSMLDSGDWLIPRLFDGRPELQKPPLYYWLVAAIGWIRDSRVDALGVRLPAMLSAVGAAVLLLLAARGRAVAGVLAVLVLLTSQHFTWIARTGRIDIPLTFAIAGAVLGLRSPLRIAQLGGVIAMTAALLLKGPIGVVLPAAIVAADALIARRRLPRALLWGIPVACLLAAPWFVAAHFRTDGEFTRQFFWHHHVERALGGSETLAAHPWWTYLARWVIDPLPWSPLLIAAAVVARRSFWLRDDPLARLGAIWIIVATLLLSLSRFKRADYLLPAYPGMALLLGCLGERLCGISFRARWLPSTVATFCLAAGVTWIALTHTVIANMDSDRDKRQFAASIRATVPAPAELLLFRTEDHLLSFHLGKPSHGLLEWENLDVWMGRPEPQFVVMPAECAAIWRQYTSNGTLEELQRYQDRTDRRRPRDLVLMRTRSNDRLAHGPDAR